MSVIVKNMGMPKNCYDCPLLDNEYGICNILRIVVYDYVPKDCPLVEVVHCKDCRHHEDEAPGMVYCPHIVSGWVSNDFFCKDGERKENNE